MKIRLSIIQPDLLGQVRNEVEKLSNAVNAGDMTTVDESTDTLVALTANSESIELTEAEWRAFLDRIRSKQPTFQSYYLLPGNFCTDLLPSATASDWILELPIDES